MKYIYTAILILFSVNSLYSQNWTDMQTPEIIKNGTGYSTHDQSFGIFEDASGNLYQTGYYEGEIKFGNSTLISVGNRDIFVAKINKNGGWDWAVSAGGASTDFSKDITCDNNGNIYITGYFYSTCNFGNFSVTAQNNSDVFVAKLSSGGEWLWAKAGLGSGFNRGNAVVCDNSGNCYISGSFESSISFGNISLSSSGLRDIFTAKIGPTGNWIWAVKAGGTGTDEPLGMKYNSSNAFLSITGYYSANCTFGQTVLSGIGGRDIFVARLDSNGSWNWAKSAASAGAEESRAVALDGGGNAVITGYYTSALTFGSTTLPAASGRDIFAAKINKSGDWVWATNATGTNDQEAWSVGLDNSGNAYITGSFYVSAKFGSSEITADTDRNLFIARISSSGSWAWGKSATGNSSIDGFGISISSNGTGFVTGPYYGNAAFAATTLTSFGDSDFFTARFSNSGTWNWAQSNGAVTGYVTGNAIALDSSENQLVTGSFYGTVRFGNDTLFSNGLADIYVAKISPEGNFIWAKSFGGSGNDIGKSLAADALGNVYLTGSFENEIQFGTPVYTSLGLNDMFVLKLNSNGFPVWSKAAGDNESDAGNKLIYKNDRIYITGIYGRKPFFGDTRLNARGNDDIFVSVMDSDGNYIRTFSAGSTQFETVNDIKLDKNNNIIITGGFEGNCFFGTINVSSNGGDDIFIAKANSSGEWQWAVKAGTANFQEEGSGLGCDNENNIYVTGSYRGLCLFGSEFLLNNGQNDIFLSKLDSNGNWVWSKGFGGTGNDFSRDLIFKDGRITIPGLISTGFVLNGKQFSVNGTGGNGFLAAFGTQGELLWVSSDLAAGFSEINSVTLDENNFAHLAGTYISSLKFGNITKNEINSIDRNAFFGVNGSTAAKPDWVMRDSTGIISVINIPKNINPLVNGRSLTNGDAVGVFFVRNSNYYCAGIGYWKNDDLEITVWGDDPNTPVKDGFAASEKYNIRVWDALKLEDLPVKVRYASGPDNFISNAVSVISQLPIKYDTLKIPLTAGWNMISSYVIPESPLMDSVFKNIKSQISIAKSGTGKTFIPQFGINTVGNWQITDGYQVYATQNTQLIILGDIVPPQNINYNLVSGWNLISFALKTPLSAVTAFASLVSQNKLVLVKSGDGKTYIPQFGINTIGNLQPGKAYQIYLSASSGFIYPTE